MKTKYYITKNNGDVILATKVKGNTVRTQYTMKKLGEKTYTPDRVYLGGIIEMFNLTEVSSSTYYKHRRRLQKSMY